jgi:hypothetical protein
MDGLFEPFKPFEKMAELINKQILDIRVNCLG